MRFLAALLVPLLWTGPARAQPDGGAATSPEVLFTFDDGPALDKTPQVVDLLDARGIKAVFFVNGWHFQGSGQHAEATRQLLREMVKRGHAVGNHTVHHIFLCGRAGLKKAVTEIEDNASLIESATGMRPDLFRTPYGAHCRGLGVMLAGLGVKPVGWDIDPQDWRVRSAPRIERYVERHLKQLRGRAILLLHDVQPATVKALPAILDWIDRENAERAAAGRPPIKIIDYSYLVPPHPLVPPALHALGRVLIHLVQPPTASGLRFWLCLAWHNREV